MLSPSYSLIFIIIAENRTIEIEVNVVHINISDTATIANSWIRNRQELGIVTNHYKNLANSNRQRLNKNSPKNCWQKYCNNCSSSQV